MGYVGRLLLTPCEVGVAEPFPFYPTEVHPVCLDLGGYYVGGRYQGLPVEVVAPYTPQVLPLDHLGQNTSPGPTSYVGSGG